MITWPKRLLIIFGFLTLIFTNILTLTNAGFSAALSGLMGVAQVTHTASSKMQSKIAEQDKAIKQYETTALKHKEATRTFSARLTSRTKRVAAKSIAAIPAESVPFIGVAVLIADTAYELYEACETVKDLDRLYSELGMEDETPDDTVRSVCDPELPDPGEVLGKIAEKPGQWVDQAKAAM